MKMNKNFSKFSKFCSKIWGKLQNTVVSSKASLYALLHEPVPQDLEQENSLQLRTSSEKQYLLESFSTKFLSELSEAERENFSVLYPWAGSDITLSTVFPKTTFLDNDEGVKNLYTERENLRFIHTDIDTFTPEERYNMLYIQASPLPHNLTLLKPGGYIICDNWWFSANELFNNPDFELLENLKTGKKNFKILKEKRWVPAQLQPRQNGMFLFRKKED